MFNVASVSAAAKQATYSRKPRRTTDGQMCTWPGCKQVFRHRNIYEEHMKMHKRGAPGEFNAVYRSYKNLVIFFSNSHQKNILNYFSPGLGSRSLAFFLPL